jgi:acyl-CoA synthetase (NDP forming)
LPPERLTADATPPTAPCGPAMEEALLSAPEVHAAVQILENAVLQGREQLFEHEVYNLLEVVGAIAPPRHEFIPAGGEVTADTVARFSGAQVVLKVVSPDIVHKTEVGGVRFVPRKIETINRELSALVREHRKGGAAVDGVLLVEFVEREGIGFGQELFVGIRSTREFGPVIAAGLGGVDTEYLAYRLKPGVAVAKAPALETSAEEFFELFRKTAAYDGVAGRARGHRRVVSDGELLRCFRAFIALAGYFCVDRGDVGPHLSELEVNPFAFTHQRLVPLDGRGRLGEIGGVVPARPLDKVAEMLEPRTIAVAGVSGQRMNFGRIMLRNTLAAGFPPEHLYVLKPGDERIDGVRCVPSPGDVPEPIDLLVAAVSSNSVPQLMRQAIESGRVRSVILIPGGMGETEASESRRQEVQGLIRASRARPDRGPVVLGGNCLGIRSVPGRYDTFFVPSEKLPSRPGQPASRTALIAQSGAFAITRISNLETIRPSLAITIGNQLDLTASDLLRVVGRRDDIDVIGAYVEGFTEGDGLAFVRAVEEATIHGKVVIFYKAGRTAPGRSATAGHTASVAGDYDVCQAAVAQAGAIVVDTFKEFEQLVELASLFHDKTVGGRRIGVISNAGFEAVGMADAIQGARYELEMPPLGDAAKGRIRLILTTHQLDGLVNVGNPLDLNPMADEDVYEGCIRAMLDDPTIDALAVSIVPFTTELRTTPIELEGGDTLVERLSAMAGASRKPLLVVLDAGPPYEILARELRRKGVPVLPSCDQAIRSLGRYLCHRVQYPRERAVDPETRRLVDQLQSALQVAPAG